MHAFASWSVSWPGLHTVQAADPSALKPLSQAAHLSFAPMLNVFSVHLIWAERAALGRCPAAATEQYAARVEEYSPGPSQGSHVAPLEEKKPGSHSTQLKPSPVASLALRSISPGLHFSQNVEPVSFSEGPTVHTLHVVRPSSLL